MGVKMKNAPVFYVVTQVQFNAVLNLESYLPTIQDRMRKNHFPDFKRQTFQKIILPLNMGEGNQEVRTPSIAPQSRLMFGDIEGHNGFVLESNGLSFQTTNYDTFEVFSKTFTDGLSILHEALNLDFTERVGIRYLDAVFPQEGKDALSDYLAPEVLGLSQKLDGNLEHSISETLTSNSAGRLVSRVIIQSGPVGLPPEIGGGALSPKLQQRFAGRKGLHAIMDTDAFYEQREAFNLKKLEKRIDELHQEIRKSFNATVTSYALDAWA